MRLLPDTGCPDGLLPSCLSCPLPECRFKLPVKEWNAAVGQVRQLLMREAELRGEPATQLPSRLRPWPKPRVGG